MVVNGGTINLVSHAWRAFIFLSEGIETESKYWTEKRRFTSQSRFAPAQNEEARLVTYKIKIDDL